MKSLDAILKGAPVVEQTQASEPAAEVEAQAPAETTEQQAARERDERGRFAAKQPKDEPATAAPKPAAAPKVDTPAAPTAAANPPPTTPAPDATHQPPPGFVPVKGLTEERRKRQDAERQLAELRAQQQQPARQISPVDDPEGYARSVAQEADRMAWNRILDFSESAARRSHGAEAVEAAKEAFKEAVGADPSLIDKLNTAADPYEFVIGWHKREQFNREVTDPDEWRKQQRELIRKELEAEAAQRGPQAQPQARVVPPAPTPSLAAAPSTGSPQAGTPAWDGPRPLSQILRR